MSLNRLGYDSPVGPREPSPDRFRLWRQAGETGARAPALAAAFELSIGHGRVVCGCLPMRKGALSRVERREVKLKLLKNLIGDASVGCAPHGRSPRPLTMVIGADSLGKPLMRIGGAPGPSVSFSLGAGLMWAAVCGEGACGIDSAHPEEFPGDYPFHRAFHEEEFPAILELTAEGRQEGAAMLWSAKEAAVKALGCGFHLLDPLDVRVFPHRTGGAGFMGKAVIRGNFPRRRSRGEETFVQVLTFRFRDSWVSAAFTSEEHSWENPLTGGLEGFEDA